MAGEHFGQSNSHMVLLSIDNLELLNRLSFELSCSNISFVTFYEPDNGMGNSAIATKAIAESDRKGIKKIISRLGIKMWLQ